MAGDHPILVWVGVHHFMAMATDGDHLITDTIIGDQVPIIAIGDTLIMGPDIMAVETPTELPLIEVEITEIIRQAGLTLVVMEMEDL